MRKTHVYLFNPMCSCVWLQPINLIAWGLEAFAEVFLSFCQKWSKLSMVKQCVRSSHSLNIQAPDFNWIKINTVLVYLWTYQFDMFSLLPKYNKKFKYIFS